eukprot:9088307-Alexandrium_andersonii.AAC.1
MPTRRHWPRAEATAALRAQRVTRVRETLRPEGSAVSQTAHGGCAPGGTGAARSRRSGSAMTAPRVPRRAA